LRALIQRVTRASVSINGQVTGQIGHGLVILVGIAHEDTRDDATVLVNKIADLRVFGDSDGKMNVSLLDIGGQALVISQFTLYADTRKGRRPSYNGAARPETAIPLYESFVLAFRERGIHVETGEFGADMTVDIQNSGPVTLMLESDMKSH
jgi:D-tyrosyl-tRNA(Tyr) deacylase